MKVAITGWSGFVWKHLVKLFLEKWHEVISCQRKKVDEIKWVQYEYFDYTFELEEASMFKNIDVFIHCGSCTDYMWSKQTLYKQNVTSLKNIRNISRDARKFIYISSSSVYQWISWEISSRQKIDEKKLFNSYSYSKYKAEEYIRNNFENKHISIFRPRAIYGKGDTTLIPQVLQNSIGGYLLLPWSGAYKTSVSEVWEFSGAVYKNSLDTSSWVFHFSSSVMSYNEIYKQIQKDYTKKWIIHIPLWVFYTLKIFNKNKYSYIIDTFWSDKILN